MTVPKVVDVVVEVDYGQFHLMRAGAAWASDQVPPEGYAAYLWSDGAFVTVVTTRQSGPMKVRVEVWDAPPSGEPADDWQHVVAISLDPGGDLEIHDWAGASPVQVVPVDPGALRLRGSWRGLVDDGSAPGDDEELLVQVWPAPPAPAEVLRCWPARRPPESGATQAGTRRQIEGQKAVVARRSQLTVVADLPYPYRPMPGGGEGSQAVAVLTDPDDHTWWVDGYDGPRTIRELSEQEAKDLLPDP